MTAVREYLHGAARALGRRPRFALGVVATLGLGIGATTTVSTVVDGVLLRPLPYDEAGRLVTIGSYARGVGTAASGLHDLGPITTAQYRHIRDNARSLEAVGVVDTERLLRPSAGLGERVVTHAISADVLGILGAEAPEAGRAFLPSEYNFDRSVVMITSEAFRRRYGSDPAVLGRPLGSPESPVLVGVLPEGFRPLEAFGGTGEAPDFYYASDADAAAADRGGEPVRVIGRLGPGVSVEQARAEVDRLSAQLSAASTLTAAALPSAVRIGLNGLAAQTVGVSRSQLFLVLAAATLLWILAAMNGATLLLTRSLERARELSVRVALGAGRAQLILLVATEALMLALGGGLLGAILAVLGVDAFRRFAPTSIARMGEVGADGRTLAIAGLITLGTGLVVAIAPALRTVQATPWMRIQAGGRATERSALHSILVAGQMAVAIVLASGAGLLFNSFVRMRHLEPGFDPEGIVTVAVPLKDAPAAAGLTTAQAWDLLLERLAVLPGVTEAGGTTALPFETPFFRVGVDPSTRGSDAFDEPIAAYSISPGYLRAMGTRLLAGRTFEPTDGPETERVALVNESFARLVLGDPTPIDRMVRLTDGDGEFRIVGLVEDVVQRRAQDGFRPAVYFAHAQVSPMAGVQAAVRTTLPLEEVGPAVRRIVGEFSGADDRAVETMEDRMGRTREDPRFQTVLVGAFGLVSTLLAAVGLYGSLAHQVGRRRREIGVRMALGADRFRVLRSVVGRGMLLACSGLGLGMVGTLLATRALAGFLFGIRGNDPVTLVAVAACLVLVAVGACLGPALQATGVDPLEVLKAE